MHLHCEIPSQGTMRVVQLAPSWPSTATLLDVFTSNHHKILPLNFHQNHLSICLHELYQPRRHFSSPRSSIYLPNVELTFLLPSPFSVPSSDVLFS